jgi:hypothetical protein
MRPFTIQGLSDPARHEVNAATSAIARSVQGRSRAAPSLAARGESLAAFDGRCILAGGVAPPSNIPDCL